MAKENNKTKEGYFWSGDTLMRSCKSPCGIPHSEHVIEIDTNGSVFPSKEDKAVIAASWDLLEAAKKATVIGLLLLKGGIIPQELYDTWLAPSEQAKNKALK